MRTWEPSSQRPKNVYYEIIKGQGSQRIAVRRNRSARKKKKKTRTKKKKKKEKKRSSVDRSIAWSGFDSVFLALWMDPAAEKKRTCIWMLEMAEELIQLLLALLRWCIPLQIIRSTMFTGTWSRCLTNTVLLFSLSAVALMALSG